jgi:hypothetical protein
MPPEGGVLRLPVAKASQNRLAKRGPVGSFGWHRPLALSRKTPSRARQRPSANKIGVIERETWHHASALDSPRAPKPYSVVPRTACLNAYTKYERPQSFQSLNTYRLRC